MISLIRKYGSVLRISLQQSIYYRASFLMDRARTITIVFAFYAFWSTLFQGRSQLAGYSISQMFTYVLGMNILRSLIFSDKTWEILREINTGRISYYLIRPISYIGYCSARDLADKIIHLFSAFLEVWIAVSLFNIPLYLPKSPVTLLAFLLSAVLAMILYFLMSYAVSALAFWTAESGGPRFCFELFLEFAAGAFFPLDVLPASLKSIFEFLPFASLLYFPLNIFLERASSAALLSGFLNQILWIAILSFVTRSLWKRGLKAYCSEGG
ncbi:MAG: ABC-2 family transporter protein [Elusimicrobia bacterium]|nr:ABC-2 family transporter protein [Elusimicrobiota bacterium]